MKYTEAELFALLRRAHAALEEITDRHGCKFPVAMTLCDCETALNSPQGKAAAEPKKPAIVRRGVLHAIH